MNDKDKSDFELEVIPEEEISVKPGPVEVVVADGHPIVEVQASEDNPAFALLNKALESGAGMDMVERFMDLQERWEKNNARKAYALAMADCQAEMQPIVAASEGEKTNSYYAKLGYINSQITPVYTKHGFSLSYAHGVPAIEGEIRTTCRVLHRNGHFEDFFIDLPPDLTGAQGTVNKTPIHARASSNSYGRRYIVMGIFNLSILSEDDDATAAGGGSNAIADEQAVELQTMVDASGLLNSALLREFGVAEWTLLPEKKFEKAKKRITQLTEARNKNK